MRTLTLKAALLAIALLCARLAGAHQSFLGDALSLPPQDDYQEKLSAHFRVVYPQPYAAEAKLVVEVLEQTHRVLSRVFNYAPNHRVVVILTDNQDFANGVTSVLGQQGLVLYLTAPDPYSSIGEYDDWLKELVVHEYAHYLTLEPSRGLFDFLHYLTGQLLYPNMLWPSWLAEGMAVYAESVYTDDGGRDHGTYYDTLTRDGLYRDKLGGRSYLTFDKIMGPVPDFPFGEGAYYAGTGIVEELMREQGVDAPARFAEESSWRVPFFIKGGLENISRDPEKPANFEELWNSWIERERRRMEPELKWLQRYGSKEPEFLTAEGLEAVGARLSPDGSRVAYALVSGHERPSLHVVSAGGERHDEKLDDVVTGSGLAWSRDGKTLYYAKTDYVDPYHVYSDLFALRLGDRDIRRLTTGERAKDPDLCGSEALVYTRQVGRISELKLLDLRTKKSRVLYRAPDYHHVSNPRCAPDAGTVYFTEHGNHLLQAIYALPLSAPDSASPRRIVGGAEDGYSALFAEPTSDGQLLFTRARNKFYELARYDLKSRKAETLAISSGGYWMPSLASGASAASRKLAVTYVSSSGIRAGLLETAPVDLSTLKTANADSLRELVQKAKAATPPPELQPAQTAPVTTRDYSLFRSLAPRIWFPHLMLSTGQSQFGAAILGWDDVDQLEYSLLGWYDTVSRSAEGSFGTFHRLGVFRLGLGASSEVTSYLRFGDSLRAYAEQRAFTLSLQRPFPGRFSTTTPELIAQWERTWLGGDLGKMVFPWDVRLGGGISYNSIEVYRYSVFPERGSVARADVHRLFNLDDGSWKAYLNWHQFFEGLPRHAAFSISGFLAASTHPLGEIPDSIVKVGGTGNAANLDLPLLGYPTGNFATRRAAVLAVDYGIPVAQLFAGFGTFPVFLQNLGAFVFYNAAKFEVGDEVYGPLVDGAGFGIQLNTTLGYQLSLPIKLEVARGLRPDENGEWQFFLTSSLMNF